LLQGLLVCNRCGYAWTGISTRRVGDPQTYYIYYRCISCASRSGEKAQPCGVLSLQAGRLEEAVWQDVCALLKHPQKMEEEYRRRLQSKPGQGSSRGIEPVTRIIAKLKRSISRLVDLYSEGLLEKQELEPRLRAAKERLSKLEAEEQQLAAQEAQQAELRLALTCLQDFAEQVKDGLERADWTTRREVIRALVRRIEINHREVRIVYRVAPVPFVERPCGGVLQDCPTGRAPARAAQIISCRSALRPIRTFGGGKAHKLLLQVCHMPAETDPAGQADDQGDNIGRQLRLAVPKKQPAEQNHRAENADRQGQHDLPIVT
jgi:site-specific DNA recombinase